MDTKLELRLSRLEAALRKEDYDIPETTEKVEDKEQKPKVGPRVSFKVSDIVQNVMKPKSEEEDDPEEMVQLKSIDEDERQFWEQGANSIEKYSACAFCCLW